MFGRFVSLPFFFLRSVTAVSGIMAGLIQTYVFARVLSPERFSLFILVGTAGFTLLLCDFGIAKILFVRLRSGHVSGTHDRGIASQATAIVIFYVLLALIGTVTCFAFMAMIYSGSSLEAAQFSLFFLFTSLNLAWFALRNITIAVDDYVFFEILEVTRRLANMVTMLAMLVGFPVTAFLVFGDLLWVVLLFLCAVRLLKRGTLTSELHGVVGRLRFFLRENRDALRRSATFAASEMYVYNFPFLLVPSIYGLGAPTIILDTTFKVFRAGSVAYSAACDLLVPRQTTAFRDRDAPTLERATLVAVALCAVPATIASTVLIYAAGPLFAWLLGPAAVMPSATTPILVVLLFSNLAQMVALSLLVHSGFFKGIACVGPLVAIAMSLASALVAMASLNFISFMVIYTAVYACGALTYVVLALRGPIAMARARSNAITV